MKKRKSKSYMSVKGYWLEIAVGTVLLAIMYYFWGFQKCFSLDEPKSLMVWAILQIIGTGVMGWIAGLRHRNTLSIWCSILAPMEIYTILVYGTDKGQVWRLLLLLAVAFLAMLAYCMLCTNQAMGRGEEFHVTEQIVPLVRVAWIILVGVYMIFMVPILFRGARGVERTLDYSIEAKDTEGLTVTSQMAELSRLDYSYWKKLEQKEREELAQLVADVEGNELGISHNLVVAYREFGEVKANSAYSSTEYKIYLDKAFFENATGEEVLQEITHQAYHAYERELVDLYTESDRQFQKLQVFAAIEKYVVELQKNIQALDDRQESDHAALEADALAYAQTRMEEYQKWITFWMKSEG